MGTEDPYKMAVHLSSPTIKNHYGIEVTKLLKWDQWEPGGEYTQLMTLKNVNSKTKKLKYRSVSSLNHSSNLLLICEFFPE